ncbi:VCBS repeat-containing protein [Cellulophaga sp. F20128]|uniref:VCBS repeat-containing protein n=1 Tax=Cellulophaga sp. F20128 TaxID=2926413 RepID=UPI001FF4581E|nr:VCBS repeat-containing protein [Cellulophaga sp. F20128]MCK0158250.1 VCBS repeat-containing protein [Cellulophaga sp. F20128]
MAVKNNVLLGLFFILVFSCKKEDAKIFNEKKVSTALFTIASTETTNINFKNELNESSSMNGLLYEYFYNGGGVAVGDLNGDDLPDIYFISNLKTNTLYLNQGKLKFKDITEISKTKGKFGFPTGVTMVDINGDGKLDIYICKSGKFNDLNKRRNELYINKGNNIQGIPVFEEAAEKYGLNLPHFSTQASFFDYDKDGDLDLFLINHGILLYPDESIDKFVNIDSKYQGERLFRNENGKFVDVTKESGIINNLLSFGLGVSIGDLNNDGWPDILVGHDYSEKDHMYLNQKNGKFKEVILLTTGHISNFSMGNDIADFNNDGLLDFITLDMMSEHNFDIKTSMSGMNPKRFYKLVDLGLHHQYMFNTLQINNGNQNDLPMFSDIAQLSGVSSTDWSWGPLFLDMDNDGLKDLFISNGIKGDFRNSDFVNYRKKRQKEIVELKKQGKRIDQKTYVNHILDKMPERKKENYFYKNNGDLTFSSIELNSKDRIQTSSNGAAYADFDNDGDMDIVVNNVDDPAFIYKNNSSELKKGNYLKVKLNGPMKNKLGIGARLIAVQEDKTQILEQYLTRGFQSSVTEILHFGLGKENGLKELQVIWPDGKTQYLNGVSANQTLVLYYKDAIEKRLDVKSTTPIFEDITETAKINFKHIENDFNDFDRESLLPHKMSNFGPGLAVGDINNDGLDDFYVGGAKGFSGELYFQNKNSTFRKSPNKLWQADKNCEDISAELFDADSDGDLDLYIVSGGNAFSEKAIELQDRLYLNDGSGNFKKSINALPKMLSSGSIVKSHDFDGDGDIDLFVGGRLIPGKYPFPAKSYLLKNESKNGRVIFNDVTASLAPEFNNLGMITAAEWVDVTGDKKKDLVILGEWTPVFIFKNEGNNFKNITLDSNLLNKTGWWFSVSSADMDNDGDMDLVLGNLGKNYKYKATLETPFEVHTADFDKSGTLDIVLSYYDQGVKYPLRGRSCSSAQMPFIKEKFRTYSDFGLATLGDVYGDDLENSLHYSATTFATSYFENLGDGTFQEFELPSQAQFSSVNSIVLNDIDGDGFKDILLVGNLYASEIETPRNDAGYGLLLKGNGKGNFFPVASKESGVFIKGDTKIIEPIKLGKEKKYGLILSKNNDYIQLLRAIRD